MKVLTSLLLASSVLSTSVYSHSLHNFHTSANDHKEPIPSVCPYLNVTKNGTFSFISERFEENEPALVVVNSSSNKVQLKIKKIDFSSSISSSGITSKDVSIKIRDSKNSDVLTNIKDTYFTVHPGKTYFWVKLNKSPWQVRAGQAYINIDVTSKCH